MKLTSFPKSSNVDGAHYDAASRTLTVKYKSGGSYTYADVPAHHWNELQKAESVGKYLHAHIKSAYKGSKVERS